MSNIVKPYNAQGTGKKEEVALMFNKIAKTYDFLNHFLSLGIDIVWRKKAIKMLMDKPHKKMLDVATGTGDFALESIKTLNPDSIIGVDIAQDMLNIAQEKINKKGLGDKFQVKLGDSEQLPFEAMQFDAVTVSFGVRNFENVAQGLSDIYRVLNTNGTVIILEFSKPTKFPIKQLYSFYFNSILPLFGKLFSKDNRAYTYLPESVYAFPDGEAFIQLMQEVGFVKTQMRPLTFGVCTIYMGSKC